MAVSGGGGAPELFQSRRPETTCYHALMTTFSPVVNILLLKPHEERWLRALL